jgi:hypothetical protein
MSLQRTQNISVSIAQPVSEVYAFLSEPQNFSKWASGLRHSFRQVGGMEWLAETPIGPMKVRFSPPNSYGVLDHYVVPEAGMVMYNPMRVFANGGGCEVVFTLFQRPGMSDDDFARDADWVRRDLVTLKALLES